MRMNKRICIRSAKKEEWESILKIQRRAIHEIACADYPPAILDLWGTPLNQDTISREMTKFDRKSEQGVFTIVAEINGTIAGFGEVIPKENLLLAVYINPDFKRQGVGTAIVLDPIRGNSEEAGRRFSSNGCFSHSGKFLHLLWISSHRERIPYHFFYR